MGQFVPPSSSAATGILASACSSVSGFAVVDWADGSVSAEAAVESAVAAVVVAASLVGGVVVETVAGDEVVAGAFVGSWSETICWNRVVTNSWHAVPGQVVSDICRWVEMVWVVISLPSGHLLDPRDVNVVVAPGVMFKPCLSASQVRRAIIDITASWGGCSASKSPRKQQSWLNPWLPPVASPRSGLSTLPVRDSQIRPNLSTKKL